MNATRHGFVRFLPAILAAASLAVFFAGCSVAVTPDPTLGPPPSTGYSVAASGSVEATGYVGRSELEGGFWALYDRPLGPSSAVQPKILAVLLPGAVSDPAFEALESAYVRVTGRVSQGPSVRMAGPEVLVDTIEGAGSDAPR